MTDEEWKKHWREIVKHAADADIYPWRFGALCYHAKSLWPDDRAKARAELLRLAELHGWKCPTN